MRLFAPKTQILFFVSNANAPIHESFTSSHSSSGQDDFVVWIGGCNISSLVGVFYSHVW
jgi:hypothetical protein